LLNVPQVSVKSACPTDRRLDGTSALNVKQRRLSGSSAQLSFDTISAGNFAEGMCTGERGAAGNDVTTGCDTCDATNIDTMVVKNTVGTVVGQLIGDGTGIRVAAGSTFPDEVATCLPFRNDIYLNDDLFDTYDVAKYDPSTQQFENLGCNGATGKRDLVEEGLIEEGCGLLG
jgi:hypothetical protein